MADTPIEVRELVFRGATHDGSQALEAHQFVPVERVDDVIAFMAANGYSCDPVIDQHVTPPAGELYGNPDDFVPPVVIAHTEYLAAQDITLPDFIAEQQGA